MIPRLKFLLVIGQLGFGGAERQLIYLARGLAAEAQVGIAVWGGGQGNAVFEFPIIESGLPRWYLANQGESRVRRLFALHRLILESRAEVVQSFSFHTNALIHVASLGTGAVAVGGIRREFWRERSASGPVWGRLCARWPRQQITNNEVARQQIRRSRIWRPHSVQVVRNAIDTSTFRSEPNQYGHEIRLLGIGSLSERKRWEILILAVALLRDRGELVRLRIVGEGPQRQTLERLVAELRLDSLCEIVGSTRAVEAEYRACTILVHPSSSEGVPNVVLEAMASGRVVIASGSGDVSSIITNSQSGLLLDAMEPEELARAVVSISRNPTLLQRMGNKGREYALNYGGVDRLAQDTLAAYASFGWRSSH